MGKRKDSRTNKFIYKYTDPEKAILNIIKKLEASTLKAKDKVCDDLTLKGLMTALMSASDFIDHAKFECGEDFGK